GPPRWRARAARSSQSGGEVRPSWAASWPVPPLAPPPVLPHSEQPSSWPEPSPRRPAVAARPAELRTRGSRRARPPGGGTPRPVAGRRCGAAGGEARVHFLCRDHLRGLARDNRRRYHIPRAGLREIGRLAGTVQLHAAFVQIALREGFEALRRLHDDARPGHLLD